MTKFAQQDRILVAGAGGFIGGWLVKNLLEKNYKNICAVDIKDTKHWFQLHPEVENLSLDLSEKSHCRKVANNADVILNLAADMGGMGFIEANKAKCMLTVLINTHLLMAAKEFSVKNYFYASSACVYAAEKQVTTDVMPLKEEYAYPAMPEDGYGWEKLFSERMCRHFREDFKLNATVARLHNVYGPHGTYDGGREKAPAAICRKIAIAKITGNHEIEVWGDGKQTRSFMYIDDCLQGILKIAQSNFYDPINLGSSELVSINQLIDIVENIAGISVKRKYKLDAPLGVRGRNSDNSLIQQTYNWQPSILLQDGLEKTYQWIYNKVQESQPLCTAS
jgi:GDP-D-mannose 3', 5'-epimerase